MTPNLATRATGLSVVLAVLSGLSANSFADNGMQGIHPIMNTRFQIVGGGFFASSDPSFRLDRSDSDLGTKVSGSDLGLDEDVTVPFAGLRWRISDRWRLEAQVFGFDESGSRFTSESIEWGNLEFDAETLVNSDADTTIGRGLIGYSFLKNDRLELGAGLGLHYMSFDVRLSGQAHIGGGPAVSASEEADADGIVPNIGLFGSYAFNEQWLVEGRFDWFSASIDDYSGDLWRVGAAVVYQPFANFNFGLSYDYLNINVDIDKSNWNGSIDSDWYGPSAFVGLTF